MEFGRVLPCKDGGRTICATNDADCSRTVARGRNSFLRIGRYPPRFISVGTVLEHKTQAVKARLQSIAHRKKVRGVLFKRIVKNICGQFPPFKFQDRQRIGLLMQRMAQLNALADIRCGKVLPGERFPLPFHPYRQGFQI